MQHYKVTWKSFDPRSVALVDDPLTTGQMAIETFIEIYSPLLETMDGRDMSSYIDFYFERSPVSREIMIFVDENARLDFRDEAILMGLIPSVQAVMEGEDEEEKRHRQEQEMIKRKAIEKQKMLRALKDTESKAQKQKKMLLSAQKTLETLEQKLQKEKDPIKRQQIETKITKILKILANKHNTC